MGSPYARRIGPHVRQAAVDPEVILRHALDGETMLEHGAHLAAVQSVQARERLHGLIDIANDKAAQAIVDHLWYGTDPEGNHRCAASHRLDSHQPKGLRPVDRKQEGPGIAQEIRLLMLVDLAHELDI